MTREELLLTEIEELRAVICEMFQVIQDSKYYYCLSADLRGRIYIATSPDYIPPVDPS